jgi:hypothetical protein
MCPDAAQYDVAPYHVSCNASPREQVDPLAGEAVHVARDDVHKDPKESNIYTFFSARHPAAGAAAAKPAGRAMFKVGADSGRGAAGRRGRRVGGAGRA